MNKEKPILGLNDKVKLLLKAELEVNGTIMSQLRVYHDGELYRIRYQGQDEKTQEHKYMIIQPERVIGSGSV